MKFAPAKPIADALLYEGYLLYPYRPSSLKNQRRFLLGGLVPQDYSAAGGGSEAWSLHSECLVEAGPEDELEARVRFLHLATSVAQPRERDAPLSQAWEKASERQVDTGPLRLAALAAQPHHQPFAFAAQCVAEREHPAVQGAVELAAVEVLPRVYQLTVRVLNLTPMPATLATAADGPDAARLRTLAAAHVLLYTGTGAFVSILDPPEPLRAVAESCRSRGAWPVLLGRASARDLLLLSPIILYDHPQVAPESPGDLFDGTEIDEVLRLRILTLTAEEQRELCAYDERARRILEQTLQLTPAELLRLHGASRDVEPAAPPTRVRTGGVDLGPGDRVWLRPRGRSDVLDLALAGQAATIASIEQDFEDRLFLTVTVDSDPGRDLGVEGKPGHRFFFRPDEVEPIGDGKGPATP